MSVAFEPLRREDFRLVCSWLEEPLVARWWDDDSSPDAIEAAYGPCVDGTEPTDAFIATLNGRPFGLIQRYAIEVYPDYAEELATLCELPADAISIDYLIGAPQLRGQGLGVRMISEFVTKSWRELPATNAAIVPVVIGNVASWHALERAGFHRVAKGDMTPDNPIDPPVHVVYRIDRD